MATKDRTSRWFSTKWKDRKRKPVAITLAPNEFQMLDDLCDTFNATRSRMIGAAIRLFASQDTATRWKAFERAIKRRGRGTRDEGWDFEE